VGWKAVIYMHSEVCTDDEDEDAALSLFSKKIRSIAQKKNID